MKRYVRFLVAIGILLVISILVLGVDMWQRKAASQPASTATPLPPGSLPIYFNDLLVGGFSPADLEKLPKVSFTDSVENKLQEGWLLRDVILLYITVEKLKPDSLVIVSSSSRGKKAQLTWSEVELETNLVMFDLSNRGTLKLVSAALPSLDTREEWVQDVDRIEIKAP